jgi:hypothetical protein
MRLNDLKITMSNYLKILNNVNNKINYIHNKNDKRIKICIDKFVNKEEVKKIDKND